MKQGSNGRRSRNRGGPHKGGGQFRPQHNMDGNSGEVKVRGNVHQVLEKYRALARDAASAGDRVAAENYYQHAEHYYRVLNAGGNGNAQEGPGARGRREPPRGPHGHADRSHTENGVSGTNGAAGAPAEGNGGMADESTAGEKDPFASY